VDGESTVTSTITVKAPKIDTKPEETPNTQTEAPTTPNTNTQTETPATPNTNTQTETPATPNTNTQTETPTTPNANTQTETPPVTSTTTETPEPTKKSNNANLKNLGIKPNDFTGFKSGTTSYSVSVPNDVTQVEVYAYKAEDKQNISGTGLKTLSEGSNPFDVVVTAEDGTQKTYRVNVIRLAKEETNNPDVEKPTNKIEVALASLQIVSVSLNEAFKPDVYEYTATAKPDAKEVIVSGSANVENAIVDINAPEEYEDGENIITITVKEKDGDDKKVYTVKVIKEASEEEKQEKETVPVAVGSIDNNNTRQRGRMSKETFIYCIGISVITLLGVIFAIIRYIKDQKNVSEAGDLDFVGDISAKEAIIDAAVATNKLANVGTEVSEENGTNTSKKGKHF